MSRASVPAGRAPPPARPRARDLHAGTAYTYAQDGFEATRHQLATDQLGTQLDAPAHWDPNR
jgi:kynurenine formamidase